MELAPCVLKRTLHVKAWCVAIDRHTVSLLEV